MTEMPSVLHTAPADWPVSGSELQLGGMPLSRLVARVGQTPFYAVERARLDARVAALRAALPPGLGIHYAIKANPMPALVQHLVGRVDGLDVASAGELKLALDAGADPREISFAGPGKRDAELLQAVAAGVLVNVESGRELAVLQQASAQLGLPARVALRVNPDFELKGSGMKMGGGPKPFGIDAEQVPALLDEVRARGLCFEGFQLFAGSQNLKAESICAAQRQSYELALRLAAQCPQPIRVLNLGGGFGIPYFPGEQALELAPIGANLAALQQRARRELPEAKLVIELGRYLVGEAGIYVTRVIDKKRSRGQVFLVCDGGLNHHLAAAGLLGQVIRRNYPATIGNRQGAPLEPVTAVGPLCTPLDLLADKMALPHAEVGDLLVIFQSGAYGASASPAAFLAHPAAAEVLV